MAARPYLQSRERAMRWKFPELRTRYDLIGAIILVSGGLGSLCIFLSAEDAADPVENVLGAELDGARKYLDFLERYGGKGSVLVHEMMLWFGGLWHGKNLAFTIAFLTAIVSFWFFYVDYFSDSDPGSQPGGTKRGVSRK